MQKKPPLQRIYLRLVAFFVGAIFLGSIFDSLGNAAELVTFRVALSITVLLVVGWFCLEMYLRFAKPVWFFDSKSVVRLTKLKFQVIFFIIGCIVLVWVPIIFPSFFSQKTTDRQFFNVVIEFRYDTLLKNYPDLITETVYLSHESYQNKGAFVNERNKVYFENIPIAYAGKTFLLLMKGDFWKIDRDSIEIEANEPHIVQLLPDGTLGEIKGRVLDMSSGVPIEGARIVLDTIISHSDYNGAFRMSIPLGLQKKEQTISIYKDGYNADKITVYPASSAEATSLLGK